MGVPLHGGRFIVLAALAAFAATACGSSGTGDVHALAAHYLAIAVDGNKHLDRDHDALAGQDHEDLRAASADLRDAAATERRFDRELLALDLPPAIRTTAEALVSANEARVTLAGKAAQASTLDALHRLLARMPDADAAVEQQVRTIRRQLGLPPPDTS